MNDHYLIDGPINLLGLRYHLVASTEQAAWMPLWCPDPNLEEVWPCGYHRGWFNFDPKEQVMWWYHEIMHYCVASPSQRRRPDFGLGRWQNAVSPTRGRRTGYNRPWASETLVRTVTAARQEIHACNLFATWSVLYPGQNERERMYEASGDFGTDEITRAGMRAAVHAGWTDGLDRLFPNMVEAELAAAAWDEWQAADL